MTDSKTQPKNGSGTEENIKPQLSPAAQRALAEAEERRKTQEAAKPTTAKEIGGRDGPEPARYGDWEKGGIASDF